MHVAAQYDHSDLIPILLNAGAEINVRDNDSRTPLHIASYFGKEEELRVLLDGNPNVYLKGIDGMTARPAMAGLDPRTSGLGRG